MQNVFVYGTLRAGEINDIGAAATLYDITAPTLIGSATLRGRLFDFGAYPGFVPDDAGIHVRGDVYEIHDDLVAVLDEIEQVYPGVEGLFVPRHVTVEVEGTPMTCRYYPVQRDAVKGLPEIHCGDWVTHRRSIRR
jgi:gamma-glutamylcyclotransferase (GGCT)/AIG2-like uncharacterized protein YtfP